MKKKFLTFILSICFIIPCMFMFSACSTTPANIEFKVENGYIQYYDGSNWNNLIAIEELEGEDGDDADIWTIGADGYWYKNGSKTNKKAVGDIGATGNGIKSIAPSSDPLKTNAVQTTYIITLDDNSTYEFVVKNGTNGDDADIWTIGADGYWYKNDVKTDKKAIGEDGDEYTIGEDGYWYLNGEKTEYKAVGEDLVAEEYTITYEYSLPFDIASDVSFNISEMFENYKISETIKSNDWLTNMPKLKSTETAVLDGWYIKGTNKKIDNYDFIGSDITLVCKWLQNPAGLYNNNTLVKTWNALESEYTEAFNGTAILGYQYNSYFADLEGELIIDKKYDNIGDYAFENCKKLTAIVLPDTITEIGLNAFSNCSELSTINLSKDINDIENSAFSNCYNIKEIKLPEGITRVNMNLFSNCKSLQSIIIPETVEEIAIGAFSGCESLTSIIIPNSVTRIGMNAFSGCSNLEKLELSSSLFSIESNAFDGCSNLEDLDLPDTLQTIGDFAFRECSNINNITLPKNLVSIGKSAFYNCSSLAFVNNTSNASLNSIGERAFALCYNLTNIDIPSSVKTIGGYAFNSCQSLTHISLPNELTLIPSSLFNGCKKLTTVNFPKNLKTLESFAFFNTAIQVVELPEGLTTIAQQAFDGCLSLKKLTIPSSVTNLPSNLSFQYQLESLEELQLNCSTGKSSLSLAIFPNITTLVIGPKATTLDFTSGYNPKLSTIQVDPANPFYNSKYNCNAIVRGNELILGCKNTKITEEVKIIADRAFVGSDDLQEIYIPANVTNIGVNPFALCKNIQKIEVDENNTIYDSRDNCNAIIKKSTNSLIVGCSETVIIDGIETIESYAFENCDNLINIHIPASVTDIKSFAFYNCSNVSSIIVDEGNTVYDSRDNCNAIIKKSTNALLYGCSETIIPDSVTSISSYAFYNCVNLLNINIPESIESIAGSAFDGCLRLQSIIIPDNVTYIGDNAFEGCKSLELVKISNKITIIPERLFYSSYINNLILSKNVTEVENYAFACTIDNIFYEGSSEEFDSIVKAEQNAGLTILFSAIYYYSESQPTTEGNYWHYDTDGITPIAW